ncbi:hypothetical protein DPMN_045195 [Dreissena polymorpha]|uniref:Uncharacterized protein n=1 Tax=Dreissena polymorpha TaxID=45954 RepID=A0A9D4D4E7_DREPO|nr:hypothetical protein DPMN_045195 [Dreissena polymorpha]
MSRIRLRSGASPSLPLYKGLALDPQGGLGDPLDPRPYQLLFHKILCNHNDNPVWCETNFA